MTSYYTTPERLRNVNKKESYLNEKIFLKMHKLKWIGFSKSNFKNENFIDQSIKLPLLFR